MDPALLHLADIWPLLAETRQRHSLSDGAGDKHADGGKNILFILGISGNMQKATCVYVRMLTCVERARFCVSRRETLQEIERIERHLEKKRNALNCVCILLSDTRTGLTPRRGLH